MLGIPNSNQKDSSNVAYAPSKTAEPAKNWGLPTLSQGALIAPSKRTPLRRRVDRAGCPHFFHFFAPSTQPGVFITIVMRNAIATLVRAASRLVSMHALRKCRCSHNYL